MLHRNGSHMERDPLSGMENVAISENLTDAGEVSVN